MQLVALKHGAAAKEDSLRFERADGRHDTIPMPRQGVLPHDLVHYVVEQGLNWPGGFLSLVAAGAPARFAENGAYRPTDPAADAALKQAEALVEALQTQLWAGRYDDEAFAYGAQTAAEVRRVPAWAGLRPGLGRALFEAAVALHERWRAVPQGGEMRLSFAPLFALSPSVPGP